jgi:DNA-directed RNA polymerase omega subunit
MDKKRPFFHLTNEALAKKFKSNFDLVNYAIKVAENMIHTGREPRVKSDTQNRTLWVLEEINQDKVEEINQDKEEEINQDKED